MSHRVVKRSSVVRKLKKPFACVTVRVRDKGGVGGTGEKHLVVQEGKIGLASPGSGFIEIPAPWVVTDQEGNSVASSRTFWISVDTFDPYHVVIDAPSEDLA